MCWQWGVHLGLVLRLHPCVELSLPWGLDLGQALIWGLKLHLSWSLNLGLGGLRGLWLKLNSDLRMEEGLCLALQMRLRLNVGHLLDLGLDRDLCTDLAWRLRVGWGLVLQLRGSHCGHNRRDGQSLHVHLHGGDLHCRHLLHGHDGRVLDL